MAIDLLRDDTNCSKIEFAKEFEVAQELLLPHITHGRTHGRTSP